MSSTTAGDAIGSRDVLAEVVDDLDSVQDVWERLYAIDDRSTPFSSPGWARAWWPHWAGDATPFVVVVRDGDAPVGVAPFFLTRRGPLRQLRGIGTIVGNYWDVIAAEGDRERAARAVVEALGQHAGRWDLLQLDRLPPGSAIEAALDASPLGVRRRPPTAAPAVELPASFDDYLASLSGNRRRQVRKRLRQIDDGPLERRIVDDPERLPAAIERWHALRTAWWEDRDKDLLDAHASPAFKDFVLAAVTTLVPQGLMVVSELVHEGDVVGVAVDLCDQGTFYYWLGGFDSEIRNLSPGNVHICATIRDSIEAGRGRYDFMVGTEPYKYDFGAVDRLQPWLVVRNGRLRSRAAFTASAAADRARGRRRSADPSD
jgi:CelD/BcsL family acetyltransferase involved in cellulose biosynthesis